MKSPAYLRDNLSIPIPVAQISAFLLVSVETHYAIASLGPAKDCSGSLELAHPRYSHSHRGREIRLDLRQMQATAAPRVLTLSPAD